MKTPCAFLTLPVIALIAALPCYASGPLIGNLQPASGERIAVLTGDRAIVNLGTKHGLVKGDIGTISTNGTSDTDSVLGKCSVTSTGFDYSVCEVIKARKEIEKGDYVSFDSMSFTDGNYYSVAMNTLAAVLEGYEPYVHLNVCIYGIYDNNNIVTGLSDQITREFRKIFTQKPRVHLWEKTTFKDLVIYPDLPADLLAFTRNEMSRNGVDVLILGRESIVDGQVTVSIRTIDKTGNDKNLAFSFAAQTRHTELNSRVVLTPQDMTKARSIPCNIVLRGTPQLISREQKAQLISVEAAGNPVVLQSLRALDFNVIGPVEIKATIDEQIVSPTKQGSTVMLSTGMHTMSVSFKRGYFFNETLLYTSDQEITKQALLDLSKEKGLVIELGINAIQLPEPVTLTIYHPTQRQRQVLKPIYGVESDKTVETFKD